VINDFIEQFTYLGIFTVLFLGGLGVPIPEELPVLAAGALAHEGYMRWWIALPVCLFGVLAGDSVLYWVGHHWGERILEWPLVRRVLTKPREHTLLEAYRRHAAKTVFTARHVMGLRAAAFLTAGIARVPFWKFVLVDGAAALIGVPTGFALAYFFTDQLEAILTDVRRVERWLTLLALVALATWIAVVAWRRSRAVAQDVDDGKL
jgi:membrane protein DedA with SNARE-associated domain